MGKNRYTKFKLFFLLIFTTFFSVNFQPINNNLYYKLKKKIMDEKTRVNETCLDLDNSNNDEGLKTVLSRSYIFNALKVIDAVNKFLIANENEKEINFIGRFIKRTILKFFFSEYGDASYILDFCAKNKESIKNFLADSNEKYLDIFNTSVDASRKGVDSFTFKLENGQIIKTNNTIEIAKHLKKIYDKNFSRDYNFEVLFGVIDLFAAENSWSISKNFDLYYYFLKIGVIDNMSR